MAPADVVQAGAVLLTIGVLARVSGVTPHPTPQRWDHRDAITTVPIALGVGLTTLGTVLRALAWLASGW